MRRSLITVAALAGALLALPVLAQTLVTATLAISWTAPTVDSTGVTITSIEAPTSYEIFISGTTTMPATPTATVPATPTSATETISTGIGATSYVSLAACNGFGCGALSAPQAITASGHPPGVPTNVKITASIASGS
jgi:hypothetical protein